MSRFAILLNGEIFVTTRLKRQLEGAKAIAADAGMTHAVSLELRPEMWVGDFDSNSINLNISYPNIPRKSFPIDKDATDGALAVAEALALGASEIMLVGGLGGQSGHALAHCGLVVDLLHRGVKAWLTSGHEEAYPLIPGAYDFDWPVGSSVSIIPFCDLLGLSLKGFKWPLSNHPVPLGSTLTMSNSVTGSPSIALSRGYGIAVVALSNEVQS